MDQLTRPAGRRRRRRPGRHRRRSSRPASASQIERPGQPRPTRSRRATPSSWPAASRARSTARSSSRRSQKGEGCADQPGRRATRARSRRTSIAAPTEAVLDNVAQSQPTVVQYFGPAVLALILQHLADHPDRAVGRPRTDQRPVRAVPDLADHDGRARHRQARRLRALRRGGRAADDRAARGRVPCPDPRPTPAGSRWSSLPADRRVARARAADRGGLGLGAAGGPAVAAPPARVGVLLGLRARDQPVQRAGPVADLRPAGGQRHPAARATSCSAAARSSAGRSGCWPACAARATSPLALLRRAMSRA